MRQTAIEWLTNQLKQLAFNPKTHLGMGDIRVTQGYLDEVCEQAKAMEKKQIIDAVDGYPLENRNMLGEEYYEKTYGGNK